MPTKETNKKNNNKNKKNRVANKKINEKEKTPTNKIPTFGDPTKTIWGKILIWILVFGMGALIIVALIVAIFQAF